MNITDVQRLLRVTQSTLQRSTERYFWEKNYSPEKDDRLKASLGTLTLMVDQFDSLCYCYQEALKICKKKQGDRHKDILSLFIFYKPTFNKDFDAFTSSSNAMDPILYELWDHVRRELFPGSPDFQVDQPEAINFRNRVANYKVLFDRVQELACRKKSLKVIERLLLNGINPNCSHLLFPSPN